MSFPNGETVIHHRRTLAAPDSDGNDAFTDDSVPIERVGIGPRDANGTAGNEQVQNRGTVIVGLTLMLPAGTVVAATDRFTVRGKVYEVDGEVEALHNPFTGWNPGLPIAVKRAKG